MFVPYGCEIWTKSYGLNYTKKLVFYNHFWQRFDAILDDVSLAKTMLNYWFELKTVVFQRSKIYGTPTLVTRLKVAPNMADPISLNENFIPQPECVQN